MKGKNTFGGLLVAGLLLIGTGTWVLAQEPIDDVYYWPTAETQQVKQTTQTKSETPAIQPSATAPTLSEEAVTPVEETPKTDQIEYVNVQDTTVTIRIKK